MKTLFISILSVLFIQRTASQVPDSSLLAKSKTFIHGLHSQSIKGTQHLFNGPEYTLYSSSGGEHPYYLSNAPLPGSIIYSGENFTDVSLLLDLDKQKLILSNPRYGTYLELLQDRIDQFIIESHTFINIRKSNGIQDGFYEVLYEGETEVIARRGKNLVEKMYATNVIYQFDSFDYYYLKVNNQYIRVKGKSDFAKVFPEQKKEVKSYIRKSGLSNQNREQLFVQVARFVDSLN